MSQSEIICRPTKWFFWRALLMLVMFGGFGSYFLYDWKIGYPKKNYIVANYKAFSAAGDAWSKGEQLRDPKVWADFVAAQTIPFEDDSSLYPPGTDLQEKWPAILTGLGEKNSSELWKDFSKEKGWPQQVDPNEDAKSKRKIDEQLWAVAVCFLLTAITLFFLIRTRGRVMKADDQGYHAPDGRFIAYADMITLDKRKWENKGLATLTYKDGEEEKKAKIDGMVYGQFKEDEGAPAEALFQRILANFEGELIEMVLEDDEDDEEAEDVTQDPENPAPDGEEENAGN